MSNKSGTAYPDYPCGSEQHPSDSVAYMVMLRDGSICGAQWLGDGWWWSGELVDVMCWNPIPVSELAASSKKIRDAKP